MELTKKDVIDYVKEQDVKFIRLAFCDIFGVQKNISILPHMLESAFDRGISFDASAIEGFMRVDKSDLFLKPDPSTLCILPWRSQNGTVVRMMCDIFNPDGTPFAGCSRTILKNVEKKAADMGFKVNIGAECEFFLFLNDNEGKPTTIPIDNGGYFDVYPLDKGENIRREICLTLEQMGVTPERSHHEHGVGQNEIDFKYDTPLNTADNLLTFKWTVANIAHSNGLHASFDPKPLKDTCGNGLHVNISLEKDGVNIFGTEQGLSEQAKCFIAGVMAKISEITIFTNPLESSYARLGEYEAPRFVTWASGNRSQLVRIPFASGASSRMELRNPDPTCNPYLAFALIIEAGLSGIKNSLPLEDACEQNLFEVEVDAPYKTLPKTRSDAIKQARQSDFVASALPTKVVEDFLSK